MENLSLQIQKALRRYEPVTVEGLTLYPILVKDLEEYSNAKPAIEFLQQSLPVAYMSKPLLTAYYAMELDALSKGEESFGLLSRAAVFLVLALRSNYEEEDMDKRLFAVRTVCDPKDPKRLLRLEFPPEKEGGEVICVTPKQFQAIRPILALQNGIELIPDDANPEIVEADRRRREAEAPKLDYKLQSLFASLCLLSGVDESEIDMWPIAKFEERKDALQRLAGYIVCGIQESQGVKWKTGNPFPSPLLNKETDRSDANIAVSEFAGGGGLEAIRSKTKVNQTSVPEKE